MQISGAPTDTVQVRIFDYTNQHWSRRVEDNEMFLKCQLNWAEDRLQARGHLFLNEIYDSLGLTRSKLGATMGWANDKNQRSKVKYKVIPDGNSFQLEFYLDGDILDKLED